MVRRQESHDRDSSGRFNLLTQSCHNQADTFSDCDLLPPAHGIENPSAPFPLYTVRPSEGVAA